MVRYKQLVGMVMRLIEMGMRADHAIDLVSNGYACDPGSLREWVLNHKEGV